MNKVTKALILLSVVFAVGAAANADLEPALWAKIAAADADEYIPVIAVMADRVSATELESVLEGAPADVRREYVTVELKNKAHETQAELREFLGAAEAEGTVRDVKYLWVNNTVSMEALPSLIQELSLRDDIERLHYSPERMVLLDDSSTGHYRTREIAWGVEKIGAPEAWDAGYNGTGVIVAVLDTGCDYLHSDLVGVMWHNDDDFDGGDDDDGNGYVDDYYGWNFYENNKYVRGGQYTPYGGGHGSHCAGTVAGDGSAGTQTGVAPGAKIMAVQVLSDGGSGYESDVWDGMGYALDNGANAISMSLGWRHVWNPDRPTWRETCENLIAGGMTLVIAAGNERGYDTPPDAIRTPGDVPKVITVGATTSTDNYASFSSPGPVTWQNVDPYYDFPYPPGLIKPDVAAPGVDIKSVAAIIGGYGLMSGTSMATPHTAGLAALILDAVPGMTNFEVKWSMAVSALDRGTEGKDNDYGHGRIQALPAIEVALDGGPFPSNDPDEGRIAYDDTPKAVPVTISSCVPNPITNGPATLNFEVGEDCEGPVTVSVYDITGRKVYEAREDTTPGLNSLSIRTDGLGTGVYVVRLAAGNSDSVVKMVVTR